MVKYPSHFLKLVDQLSKFPGVGKKSAERFAFHMLQWPHSQLHRLGETVQKIPDELSHCPECGCLKDKQTSCLFCHPVRHQTKTLCVIASSRDAFAIEETGQYKGLYHVLGGLLSPMDGFGPEQLEWKKLMDRIQMHQIKEIVIALDSTVEGDATALFLKQYLETMPLQVTRLAFGLPMGSSLNYVDGGTLARAFVGRNKF